MALYPPEKNPNVIENTTRSPIAPSVVRPQKRNVASAQQMGGMADTAGAERGNFLLSLSQPKKDEAMMPGALKTASMSVPEVCDSKAMSRAYVLRYVCGIP